MWSKFLISIAFISSLFLIIFFAEHLTQLRFISRETAPNEQDDGVSSEQTSFDVKGDAKLLFVGDMFFDRYIRKMARIYGEDYLFTCADKVFDSEDMVIGNLEGPITNEPSISEGSEIGSPENYRFTFPTTTAELLRRHSISSVDLGNNHIANYGTDGLRETKHYLTLAQVGYFGGIIGDEAVLESEVNGLPIAFVSYNAFLGTSTDAVAQVIRAEKEQGRIVIVSAHWGDEYSTATEKL